MATQTAAASTENRPVRRAKRSFNRGRGLVRRASALTVAETRRLERVGKAVDELLNKIST